MNAITNAFVDAALKSDAAFAAAQRLNLGKALKNVKDFKSGWNLSASYKTYQALKAQGYVS